MGDYKWRTKTEQKKRRVSFKISKKDLKYMKQISIVDEVPQRAIIKDLVSEYIENNKSVNESDISTGVDLPTEMYNDLSTICQKLNVSMGYIVSSLIRKEVQNRVKD